jgi:ABC-type antimicrobial peptide transport system permease subunit
MSANRSPIAGPDWINLRWHSLRYIDLFYKMRVALGAASGTVVRLVLGDGLRLAVAGLVIGAAVALAAMRVLRSMLYGVGPTDPLTFAAVALLVTAIALVASYVPARRALRIDPAEALRAD